MEMFNVHRRDIFNFDDYMDLKKPGFGGPKSAKAYLDGRGKRVNDSPKLKEYQRVVDRHPAFGNHVYDPTYKAMTHDVIYKQEKKKPFTYPDSYNHMGLPVVMVGKAANEGLSCTSFNEFINEGFWKSDVDDISKETDRIRREMEKEEEKFRGWKEDARETPYGRDLPVYNKYREIEDEEDRFDSWRKEAQETPYGEELPNYDRKYTTYGANPMGDEKKIGLRGKTDSDAIGDAEDKLFDENIDWDDFYIDKRNDRVDYLDKDGDLVAYVDIKGRKLYIMPDAPTLSDEQRAYLQGEETEKEMGEEEDEIEDTFYSEEEEEEEKPTTEYPRKEPSTREIENLLRSFEDEEEED